VSGHVSVASCPDVCWHQASGYNSDDLDDPEDEEEEEESLAKKRKLTKAAEAKQKAKAKKKKKGSDDEDYNDEDDAYTALSKSLWTNNGSSSSKPPVGSFEECAVCEKQFTVVCPDFRHWCVRGCSFNVRPNILWLRTRDQGTSVIHVPKHQGMTHSRNLLLRRNAKYPLIRGLLLTLLKAGSPRWCLCVSTLVWLFPSVASYADCLLP
jgi:hypothetical protein